MAMSRLERLRSLVNQRINAAADDIGRLLEGKIQEYEEEVRFFREENNSLQQKLLQFAAKADVQVVVLGDDESGSSDEQDESPPDDPAPGPDAAPAPGPVRASKRPQTPAAQNKDTDESPGTSSAPDEETEAGGNRNKSKRRAPAQDHQVKAKRSKT